MTKFDHIFTLEENVATGGFGQNLAAALAALPSDSQSGNKAPKVHIFALPDDFPPQGKREEIFTHLGLDADSMLQRVLKVIKND
jgi:deoxyxylulose-5-phosphate synthase